jgi:hypothetical protein
MAEMLNASKDKVLEMYKVGNPEQRSWLEGLYGKAAFVGKLSDRMKLFEDLVAEFGARASEYTIDPTTDVYEQLKMQIKRLTLMAKVFNAGRKVNLADTEQYKYTPYHIITPDKKAPGGFRLAYYVYDFAFDLSNLGGRPAFLDSNDAIYCGTQFIDEFTNVVRLQNSIYQL